MFAIAGGVCLFIGLIILQATSAFWTTESLEVWNAFTYGGVTMSQYPLSIYRPWFRRFFTFVIPLGVRQLLPGRGDSGAARSARHAARCSSGSRRWQDRSSC